MSFTPEEMAWRRRHLGASEIAGVAGLSPWESPITVWETKIFGLEFVGNEATEIGHLCEPIAAELYSRRTGRALRTSKSLEHPVHQWASATPDRIVEGEPILVECKAVGVNMASEWGDEEDAIPEWYRAQVEWQMEVAGVARCDVAALIGTRFAIYTIHRDPSVARVLLETGRAFWFDHVIARVMPVIDASDATTEALTRRYPRERDADLAPMPLPLIPWLGELRDAKAARKDAEERVQLATNVLRSAIRDGAGFIDPVVGKVTWTQNESDGVDWKALAQELLEGRAHDEIAALADRFTVRPGPRVLREAQPSKSKKKSQPRALRAA